MGILSNLLGGLLGGGTKSKTFTFGNMPTSQTALQAMPEAGLRDEFAVAALSAAVLCNYENNVDETVNMLNFLRGPRPLTPRDIQFLRDRLSGKSYKMRSYFKGSSPANNYTPAQPYQITVSSNAYSYQQKDYATLYLKSSGADSPRPVTLRRKPSTSQWFVWEINYLSDIRMPASENPWK